MLEIQLFPSLLLPPFLLGDEVGGVDEVVALLLAAPGCGVLLGGLLVPVAVPPQSHFCPVDVDDAGLGSCPLLSSNPPTLHSLLHCPQMVYMLLS